MGGSKHDKRADDCHMEIDSPGYPQSKKEKISKILSLYLDLNASEQYECLDELLLRCGSNHLQHIAHSIGPSLKRDFIRLLPAQLSLHILSLLDVRSLCRAATVNHQWHSLISSNDLLWSSIASRISGKKIKIAAATSKSLLHLPKLPKEQHQWSSNFYRMQAKRYFLLEKNWKTGLDVRTISTMCHNSNVVTCLQFDSAKIVSGSDDSFIKIWNPIDGSLVRVLQGHLGGVWALQYIGNVLVSGSTDRTLRIWDMDTGICLKELVGHSSTVRCLAMNKERVISGSRDQTLRIWDLQSGKCLFILQGHSSSVRCIALQNDRVASGSYDCTIRIWCIYTGECLMELTGHTQRIYSLAFDGKYVVSGSQDASIRVYNAKTGQVVSILTGHRSLVGNLQLEGKYLLSGNTDSTVRMWNVETGQCLYRLQGHIAGVSCLYFDEKWILTGSDRVLKLWDKKTGSFIRDVIDDVDVVWRVVASENMIVAAVQSAGIASLRIIHLEPN